MITKCVPAQDKATRKLYMSKITCLVSSSYNQGLSDVKQLKNNSDEENQ
jgi:hypothetical protein